MDLLFNAILQKVIILIFIFISSSSFGLGLGEIKVYSCLNEPLNAEIEINDIADLDPASVIAELASPKDFMSIGIPRVNYLNKIKFKVQKVNDKLAINLSTVQAVKNPFIDFLIQVVWPDGKIIKNYTILLDPQEFQSDKNSNNKTSTKKDNVPKEVVAQELFVSHPEESLSSESLYYNSEKSEDNLLSSYQDHTYKKNNNKKFDNISTEDEVHSYAVIQEEEKDPFMLNKVVSSLKSFSDQANRPKVNYEKLFNQRWNDFIPLKEQDPSLKSSDAMNKINNQLRSNQEENTTKNDQNNVNVNSNSSSEVNNNLVKFNSLELVIKYSNDLLWSCCLVLMIIFLFHKMVSSSCQPMQFAFNEDQANNLPYKDDYDNQSVSDMSSNRLNTNNNNNLQNNNYNQYQSRDSTRDSRNDFFSKISALDDNQLDLNINKFALREVDVAVEENKFNDIVNVNNNFVRSINEELELKISLAKQYLDVGDQKSAKDILKGINISKENFYKEQIISLLKAIDC